MTCKRRIRAVNTVPYLLRDRAFITTAPYARRHALVLTARKTPGGYYTDFIPLFGRWPKSFTVFHADTLKRKRIKNLKLYGLVETSRPEVVHAYTI